MSSAIVNMYYLFMLPHLEFVIFFKIFAEIRIRGFMMVFYSILERFSKHPCGYFCSFAAQI